MIKSKTPDSHLVFRQPCPTWYILTGFREGSYFSHDADGQGLSAQAESSHGPPVNEGCLSQGSQILGLNKD